MSMDEHTRACLQAILDGKQMQTTIATMTTKPHDAALTGGEAVPVESTVRGEKSALAGRQEKGQE